MYAARKVPPLPARSVSKRTLSASFETLGPFPRSCVTQCLDRFKLGVDVLDLRRVKALFNLGLQGPCTAGQDLGGYDM